jgi:pentatricopeptide repeat protein
VNEHVLTAAIQYISRRFDLHRAIDLVSNTSKGGFTPTSYNYNGLIFECVMRKNNTAAVELCAHILKYPALLTNKSVCALIQLLFISKNGMMALQLLRCMQNIGLRPDNITFTTLISGFTAAKEFYMANDLCTELAQSKFLQDVGLNNAVMRMHCASGRVDAALEVFSTMTERNPVTFTILISECTKAGRFADAYHLYSEILRDGMSQDVELINTVLNMYCANDRINDAVKIFDNMPVHTLITYNIILSGCTKAKRFDIADEIYSKLSHANLQSVEIGTALIKMYCSSGRIDNALQIFNSMTNPNAATFTVMIAGCNHYHKFDIADGLFSRILGENIPQDVELCTTVIKMYCASGRIDNALQIFNSMTNPNATAYTVMITGCTDSDRFDTADELIMRLHKDKIDQDVQLANTLLKLYCASDRFPVALKIYNSLRAKKERIEEVTHLIMISGCMQALDYAALDKICLYIENQEHLTVTLTTALISMYFDQAMHEKAYELFYKHIQKAEAVSLDMFVSLLTDVSSQQFSYLMEKKIMSGDFVHPLGTCIRILCFAQRTEYKQAQDLFDHTEHKDINLWHSLLLAYKLGGKGKNAIETLKRMSQSDIAPDSRSYLIALTACSHCGLVGEAESIISILHANNMLRDEHRACMVDAYARKGMLDEAEQLAGTLTQNKKTVWLSVLGGCKKFKDTERAKRITPYVKGKARSVAAHLLLANTYASAGMMET